MVFHLRELAKAYVMARYLAETETALDPVWFGAREEPEDATGPVIPRRWNDGFHSQALVQDGKIMTTTRGWSPAGTACMAVSSLAWPSSSSPVAGSQPG